MKEIVELLDLQITEAEEQLAKLREARDLLEYLIPSPPKVANGKPKRKAANPPSTPSRKNGSSGSDRARGRKARGTTISNGTADHSSCGATSGAHGGEIRTAECSECSWTVARCTNHNRARGSVNAKLARHVCGDDGDGALE